MRIAVAGGTGTVGRYVVEEGRSDGHEMVVLSRSHGVDLRDPGCDGALATALGGVGAVVDTTDPRTLTRRRASAFFEDVARRLHRIGSTRDVHHLVTLSILGADRVPGFGYYEAKQRHEAVSLAGPLPTTVVRAAQFHELPVTFLRRTRHGPVAFMMAMRSQPVAARTVGRFLLDTALRSSERPGGVLELAGPEPDDLVSMARHYLRREGARALVVPVSLPGAAGRSMRRGALLPGDGVPRLGPTFAEWLDSDDAVAAGRGTGPA